MPRPITKDIWQSLGLHLVNINAYAKFYQNIPNGLRVINIFHEQAGDKIFTNRPGTKSSKTVQWQNQMFDYRALYEIQVSVDFLRVVQWYEYPVAKYLSVRDSLSAGVIDSCMLVSDFWINGVTFVRSSSKSCLSIRIKFLKLCGSSEASSFI